MTINTENLDAVLGYIIESEEKSFIESYNSGDGWWEHIYLKALQAAQELGRIDLMPKLFIANVKSSDDPEASASELSECEFNLELALPGRPVSGTDGSVDGVDGLWAFLDNQYPFADFFRVMSIERIE